MRGSMFFLRHHFIETALRTKRTARLAQRRVRWCAPILLGMMMGILTVGAPPWATADEIVINREYTIKAAFLYHFSTYIEWPETAFEGPASPFVIAIYASDPFGAVLDKIAASKKVGGRPIEVRRVSPREPVSGCHILFIPAAVSDEVEKALLGLVDTSRLLCVGEEDGFISRGGGVQFFEEGNKIRFAFNKDLSQGELKISSKLLSLAKDAPSP